MIGTSVVSCSGIPLKGWGLLVFTCWPPLMFGWRIGGNSSWTPEDCCTGEHSGLQWPGRALRQSCKRQQLEGGLVCAEGKRREWHQCHLTSGFYSWPMEKNLNENLISFLLLGDYNSDSWPTHPVTPHQLAAPPYLRTGQCGPDMN